MPQLPWLDPSDPRFPPVENAFSEPNGLLAVGGDLSSERLLEAYKNGIFPWYDNSQPILWWSPDPRAVLFPEKLHISRTLRKQLRRHSYRCTADSVFNRVIDGCASLNDKREGTWITEDMRLAYQRLHHQGWAHSVEVWQDESLIGGLYGIALGKIFFGESMFSTKPDASKIALIALCQELKNRRFQLIDCQVGNPYLFSMGAEEIPRNALQRYLNDYATPTDQGQWLMDWRSSDNNDNMPL